MSRLTAAVFFEEDDAESLKVTEYEDADGQWATIEFNGLTIFVDDVDQFVEAVRCATPRGAG